MATIRHLRSWNFWSTVSLGCLICIAVPNFTKIGQTVAEISHLTIFKMAAVRHVGFLKILFFKQLVCSGGLIGVIMLNFIKIGQTVSEISRFLYVQDGRHLPYWIFFKSICLTFLAVKRAKFRRNRSNRYWNIAIYPLSSRWRPSAILDLWGKFWDDPQREFYEPYHCAKFGFNHILVIMIIQKCEYFVRLTWKRLSTPLFGLFWE